MIMVTPNIKRMKLFGNRLAKKETKKRQIKNKKTEHSAYMASLPNTYFCTQTIFTHEGHNNEINCIPCDMAYFHQPIRIELQLCSIAQFVGSYKRDTSVKRRNYAIYFVQFCLLKSSRSYEIPKRFSHLTAQNLIVWQDLPYKAFLARV